jgi:two-component system, chemotaxis family, CheB/CheR fusion protein
VREPLLVLDRNLTVRALNRAFASAFQFDEDRGVGAHVSDLPCEFFRDDQVQARLEDILASGEPITDLEVVHTLTELGERTMLLNASEIRRPGNQDDAILVSIDDVTADRWERDRISDPHQERRGQVGLGAGRRRTRVVAVG